MRTWTTPEGLAFEDEQTGDGRLFVAGSLTWEDQPDGWPLRYDPEDDGGHNGAVLIGAIGTLERSGAAIRGTGTLDDDGDEGAEVARMLDEGAPLGTSIDIDDIEVEWVLADPDEVGEEEVVILAASLPTGRVYFDGTGRVAGMAAPGLRSLMASAGLVAAAGEGDPEDGVIMFTEALDDIILRFTRARIRGATLVDIPAFANARIVLDAAGSEAADDGAGTDTADEGVAAASGAQSGESGPCVPCLARADALVAASAPIRPPREWFANPGLGELTPMTYGDDGRVFGHIAGWSTCHTGSPDGACVLTPRSPSGYAFFHVHGPVITAEGDELAHGVLTLGGGHADPLLSYRGAIEHYDDVSTAVADIRAGEDQYGVWVAGALRPDVAGDELRMRQLRGAVPSGDWRWVAGALELTHALSVNAPGFPVPRAQVASGGRVTALVAAGSRDVALARRRTAGGASRTQADIIAEAVDRGIALFMERAEQANRQAAAARLRRHDPARRAAVARLRDAG